MPTPSCPLGKQTTGAKEHKNYGKRISLTNQLIVTHHLIRSLMAAENYKSQTSSCDGNTTPHTPSPQVPNPSHLHRCWSILQSHQNAALLRTETSLNENQREIKKQQENIEKNVISSGYI